MTDNSQRSKVHPLDFAQGLRHKDAKDSKNAADSVELRSTTVCPPGTTEDAVDSVELCSTTVCPPGTTEDAVDSVELCSTTVCPAGTTEGSVSAQKPLWQDFCLS